MSLPMPLVLEVSSVPVKRLVPRRGKLGENWRDNVNGEENLCLQVSGLNLQSVLPFTVQRYRKCKLSKFHGSTAPCVI